MDNCMLFGADNINCWFSCFFQRKRLLGLADYFTLSGFTSLDNEATQ